MKKRKRKGMLRKRRGEKRERGKERGEPPIHISGYTTE